MLERPSWIVLSTAPREVLRRSCPGTVRCLESAKGGGAVFEPEPGEKDDQAHELALAFSKEHAGRHYAVTLAPFPDDPSQGVDQIVVYEGGKAVGRLKTTPSSLVAHLGLTIPGLEAPTPTFDPARDLSLAPMPKPEEPKFLGSTIGQWKNTFATRTMSDVSYLVDGADRGAYKPLLALLKSENTDERAVAACLLYFAEPDLVWQSELEAARSVEKDKNVQSALVRTLGRWQE